MHTLHLGLWVGLIAMVTCQYPQPYKVTNNGEYQCTPSFLVPGSSCHHVVIRITNSLAGNELSVFDNFSLNSQGLFLHVSEANNVYTSDTVCPKSQLQACFNAPSAAVPGRFTITFSDT